MKPALVLPSLALAACTMFACTQHAEGQTADGSSATAQKRHHVAVETAGLVGRSDIVLERANRAPREAMPLGNGRLGAAVWSADGLTVQLNRSDTLPGRYSPGQVVVPDLERLAGASDYQGRLDLYSGVFAESGNGMRATVYVAPHQDVVVVDVHGSDPGVEQTALLHLWKPRKPRYEQWGQIGCLSEVWKDDRLPGASAQQFGSLAAITAEGKNVRVEAKDPLTIAVHFFPTQNGHFRILVGAPHYNGTQNVRNVGRASVLLAPKLSAAEQYWHSLWEHTAGIRVSSPDGVGEYMEALRTLYLFTSRAENGGRYPGSQAGVADLFSSIGDAHRWDPAGYWHWNLRMQVAANLEAGLPKLNAPYFRLYRENLPAMERWTADHWTGSAGVCLPETLRFNGNGIIFEQAGAFHKRNVLSSNCDETSAPYFNARTLSTGAEVSLWIWQHYLATNNKEFLAANFPVMLASAVFLMGYEKSGPDGLRHTNPSNAHETQWDTVDPTTDLAARTSLYDVTRRAAIVLGGDAALEAQLAEHLQTIPDYPRTQADHAVSLLTSDADRNESTVIGESYRPAQVNKNYENIGLELVWPYQLIDDQSPLFELARRTYFHRPFKMKEDWSFDPMQAAQLGLGEEVRATLLDLTQRYQSFPNGFSSWGGADGEFYVEQIGIVAATLPMTLVQEHRSIIVVAPAVPPGWTMQGTVAVRGGNRIEVESQNGSVTRLGIEAHQNGSILIRNPWPGERCLQLRNSGRDTSLCADSRGLLEIFVIAGETYSLRPASSPELLYRPFASGPAHHPKRLGPVQLGLFHQEADSIVPPLK